MYEIFVSVINKGGYKLGDMIERIKTYAAEGKLTMDEMEKLEALAREKANVQDGTDMLGMLLEHETRIRALEAKVGVDAPETDEDGAEIVPEFVVGKTYYNGDKVTFNGSVYKCIAPKGDVCVWSPVEYPVYWELVG